MLERLTCSKECLMFLYKPQLQLLALTLSISTLLILYTSSSQGPSTFFWSLWMSVYTHMHIHKNKALKFTSSFHNPIKGFDSE